MDALVLSDPGCFALIGTQIWAIWLEWWALKWAQIWVSAHDAQIGQGCRKDTDGHQILTEEEAVTFVQETLQSGGSLWILKRDAAK